MALQSFEPCVYIPPIPGRATGTAAFDTAIIDAADEKAGWVFSAPKTGNIAKVGFLTRTVTTGATVDVRLETVSLTTGDPTGTLFGTNTNASQVIADANDNTWFLVTLTAAAAVTKGNILAAIIANPSVSPGNMQIATFIQDCRFAPTYYVGYTTGWAKSSNAGAVLAIEYDDGSYAFIPGAWPISALTNLTYSTESAADEVGLIFSVPFPIQVSGAWAWVDINGDMDFVLYDSNGTSVLATQSIDANFRVGAVHNIVTVSFPSTYDLLANTSYRLIAKPTTTTPIGLQYATVNTAALMDGLPGGQEFHYTSRVDAGSWTEVTTRRPFMGLIVSGFASSGGGGPLIGPGRIVRV